MFFFLINLKIPNWSKFGSRSPKRKMTIEVHARITKSTLTKISIGNLSQFQNVLSISGLKSIFEDL